MAQSMLRRSGTYAAQAGFQTDMLGLSEPMDTAAIELKLLDLAKLVRTAQECQHQSDRLHELQAQQLSAALELLQAQLRQLQAAVFAPQPQPEAHARAGGQQGAAELPNRSAGTQAAHAIGKGYDSGGPVSMASSLPEQRGGRGPELLLARVSELRHLTLRVQAVEEQQQETAEAVVEAAASSQQAQAALAERVAALEATVACGRGLRSVWAEQQDIAAVRGRLDAVAARLSAALEWMGLAGEGVTAAVESETMEEGQAGAAAGLGVQTVIQAGGGLSRNGMDAAGDVAGGDVSMSAEAAAGALEGDGREVYGGSGTGGGGKGRKRHGPNGGGVSRSEHSLPPRLQQGVESCVQAAVSAAMEDREAAQREREQARTEALATMVQSVRMAQETLLAPLQHLATILPCLSGPPNAMGASASPAAIPSQSAAATSAAPPGLAHASATGAPSQWDGQQGARLIPFSGSGDGRTSAGQHVGSGGYGIEHHADRPMGRDAQLEEAYMLAAEAGGLVAGLKVALAEAMLLEEGRQQGAGEAHRHGLPPDRAAETQALVGAAAAVRQKAQHLVGNGPPLQAHTIAAPYLCSALQDVTNAPPPSRRSPKAPFGAQHAGPQARSDMQTHGCWHGPTQPMQPATMAPAVAAPHPHFTAPAAPRGCAPAAPAPSQMLQPQAAGAHAPSAAVHAPVPALTRVPLELGLTHPQDSPGAPSSSVSVLSLAELGLPGRGAAAGQSAVGMRGGSQGGAGAAIEAARSSTRLQAGAATNAAVATTNDAFHAQQPKEQRAGRHARHDPGTCAGHAPGPQVLPHPSPTKGPSVSSSDSQYSPRSRASLARLNRRRQSGGWRNVRSRSKGRASSCEREGARPQQGAGAEARTQGARDSRRSNSHGSTLSDDESADDGRWGWLSDDEDDAGPAPAPQPAGMAARRPGTAGLGIPLPQRAAGTGVVPGHASARAAREARCAAGGESGQQPRHMQSSQPQQGPGDAGAGKGPAPGPQLRGLLVRRPAVAQPDAACPLEHAGRSCSANRRRARDCGPAGVAAPASPAPLLQREPGRGGGRRAPANENASRRGRGAKPAGARAATPERAGDGGAAAAARRRAGAVGRTASPGGAGAGGNRGGSGRRLLPSSNVYCQLLASLER